MRYKYISYYTKTSIYFCYLTSNDDHSQKDFFDSRCLKNYIRSTTTMKLNKLGINVLAMLNDIRIFKYQHAMYFMNY